MEYKSEYGQFFTAEDMCKKVIDIVNNIKPLTGDVLEPSFGNGNFIKYLSLYDVNVDGVEIDETHFNSYKNSNVNLYNEDFLLYENKMYDFIIGNPPYIELCYSFYDKKIQDQIKKKYKGISNGRINLVHIFMKKSMDILKEDGIIAYLLPSAILTSPTYKNIRAEIYNNYNVEYLIEDVSFQNVAIKVCLLVIRKNKTNDNYFYLNNDNYFIMKDYNKFDKTNKTLKDSGFNVSIGEIVWNLNKEKLNDVSGNILVYSSNIDRNKLELIVNNNKEKKQYIQDVDIKYQNCIIFPRTVSKKIKYYYVENNTNMVFENHVLVLTHENKAMLDKVYENLNNGIYDDLLVSFFNSSNLTKGELLSLPL